MSVALAWLLALETMPLPAAARQQPKPRLNIIIIQGEGAINNIRQRTAREPIVEVEDENLRPVAGAAVVFLLPDRGPSGVFLNGSHMTTVITDRQGRAEGRGLRPNELAGEFQIRVSASHQGRMGSATITQTNVLGPAAGGASGKTVGLLAAVSGAVAVGLVVALRARRSPILTTPPIMLPSPIVITPGLPSVGAPR
jgi:hypothetical protein